MDDEKQKNHIINRKEKANIKIIKESKIKSGYNSLEIEKVAQINQQQKINTKNIFQKTNLIRHVKAMLIKELMLYKRNYMRSILNVILPMLVYLVLGAIRHSIHPSQQKFNHEIDKHIVSISPFPNSQRLGFSNSSQDQILFSFYQEYLDLTKFYDFNQFTDSSRSNNNIVQRWLSDNCKQSDINRERRMYGIVGNVNQSIIIQDFIEDMQSISYIRNNSFSLLQRWNIDWLSNNNDLKQPFEDLKNLRFFHDQPYIFESESELFEFINQESYEKENGKQGMCFAIKVEENISNKRFMKNGQNPYLKIKMYSEAKDGLSPSQVLMDGETSGVQQILPSLSLPSFDSYQKTPNIRAAELYVRQGFSWIQNQLANSALRLLTENKKAKIVQSFIPSLVQFTIKDEFEQVQISIYSYISIVIYMMPMYQFIQNLQSDKQQGIYKHLQVNGLSQTAQYIALFISYVLQITIISLSILFVIQITALFPKSMKNSWFLLFTFSWLQGIQNFGYIIMISSFLPQDMYPKMAAKWGSLIYFSSTFADFTIQKAGISENKKLLMSFIFPNLAIARATRNLCVFEYNPSGVGLSYQNLFEQFQNYRIINFYYVMPFAFLSQLIIGLTIEKWKSQKKFSQVI